MLGRVPPLLLAVAACSGSPPPSVRPEPTPVVVAAPKAAVSASASGSASASAPAPASFRVPPESQVEQLWGEGDLMIVRTRETFDEVLMAVPRNGAPIKSQPARAQVTRCAFASRQAVLAGESGMMERFNGSTWERFLAPALDAESLGGVAMDSRGRTLVAGQHSALYVLDGSTWKIERYPSTGMSVVSLAMDTNDTAYLVGSAGRIVAYTGGSFRDVAVSGLTADALATKWVDAWLSRKTRTLYIAAQRALIAIDVATAAARIFKTEHAVFFEVDGMTGTTVGTTDLIVLSSFGDGALFDGTNFYKLTRDARHGGFIDPKDKVVYGADRAFSAAPLVHPALGTGKGTPVTP